MLSARFAPLENPFRLRPFDKAGLIAETAISKNSEIPKYPRTEAVPALVAKSACLSQIEGIGG